MHFDDFIQKNLNKRKPSTDTNIQLHYQNPNNISELFKSPLEFKTQSYQGFMPIVFFFFFLSFFFFPKKSLHRAGHYKCHILAFYICNTFISNSKLKMILYSKFLKSISTLFMVASEVTT